MAEIREAEVAGVMRAATSLSIRFRRPVDILVDAGIDALMHAANKFDPARCGGRAFTGYAGLVAYRAMVRVCRREQREYSADVGGLVAPEQQPREQRTLSRLVQEWIVGGDNPERVAAFLGVPITELGEMAGMGRGITYGPR